jgi:uncharacterized Fe-S cluster protein YjdI/CDGSH-type Zn-finger protein
MPSDLSRVTKKYTNGQVTVVWKPSRCIHSGNCFKGLPGVFDPAKRPWINPEGQDTENIINQVKLCPSAALSYYMNSETEQKDNEPAEVETRVEVKPNGPLLVHGSISIRKADGKIEKRNSVTAFCRCSNSNNKPFCDGSHVRSGFKG